LSEVAVDYLEDWNKKRRTENKPFAMWLSYPDPHEFYQAPKDIVESIDPDSIAMPPNWESDIGNRAGYMQFMHWYFNAGGVPESVVKRLIRIYLAMCKNVDVQLNRVFKALEEMGAMEDTIIIYTSDHGDFNGEHGLLQKFNSGYDGCCRVPLIISWPGKSKGGRRCSAPVNLMDIPATLSDLMGWEKLPEDRGRSLADILTKDEYEIPGYTVVESGVPGQNLTEKDIKNFPNHRWDRQPVGRWCYDPPHRFGGKMYAVRSRKYKLIVRQDQKHEFYDMDRDPWEAHNCADSPDMQGEILRHYQYLTDHLEKRIAHSRDGTLIAKQDSWYKAGGELTWDESLPEA
jgi:arylsulfatase A-like enzyme